MGAFAYLLVPMLAVTAAFFYLSPPPFNVDIGPWEAQPLPERVGVLAPNTLLDSCTLLGEVNGAETVAVGPDGRVYGGTADGWIVAVNPTSGEVEKWANVRGRPLGLDFDKEGDLIVADGLKGLLHVNATTKRITILAHDAGGRNIVFADDVAIAEDGTIYFSDATSVPPVQKGCGYDPLAASLIDILSSKPRGRLIRYSADKGTEVLFQDIHFANGVALAKDESFVIVVETPRARVLRYWLKGPKAGTSDVFVDGLPGMADGVSRRTDGSGHFWLALVATRDPVIEFIAAYPLIRAALLKIGIPTVEKHHGHILELDERGNIVRSLEGSTASITAVTELEGKLYLGHLHAPRITVCDLQRL